MMTEHSSKPDPEARSTPADAAAGQGETLAQLANRLGPLPWPVVRWIAIQLTESLEACHTRGLIHGEISLESIHLARPWPCHEVTLKEAPSEEGNPMDDLQAIHRLMHDLLSGGILVGGNPINFGPEVESTLGKLAAPAIPDARDFIQILVDDLIASLPAEENGLPTGGQAFPNLIRSPEPSTTPPHFPATRAKPVVPMIAAAAAAILLVGTLLVFPFHKFRPSRTDNKSDHQEIAAKEQSAKELAAKEKADKEQAARELAEKEEKAAKELAAKEKADKEEKAAGELAAKKKAEKEKAEKEQAARDLAAQEQAAMAQAATEQAAIEAAQKQAEEKVVQDNALAAEYEAILEQRDAPASEKERAFSGILALAEDGNLKAIEICGASYWMGSGVEMDRKEARKWFEKGAELGNGRSMLGLGYCHEQGIGGPEDMAKAVAWWRKAAAAGVPRAMSRLGEHFVANDPAEALPWFQKASDLEVPEAMTNLGILLEIGKVVPRDSRKAIDLWEKASALGETRAMTELGYIYFNRKDETSKEAFRLFKRAVEANDPRAMTGLGACYYEGVGTKANREEASEWFRRAKKLGEPTATEWLEKTANPQR